MESLIIFILWRIDTINELWLQHARKKNQLCIVWIRLQNLTHFTIFNSSWLNPKYMLWGISDFRPVHCQISKYAVEQWSWSFVVLILWFGHLIVLPWGGIGQCSISGLLGYLPCSKGPFLCIAILNVSMLVALC